MNANDLIYFARIHLDSSNSSATFCLASAWIAREKQIESAARKWALRSLAHSVGILSPLWKEANDGKDVGLEVTL